MMSRLRKFWRLPRADRRLLFRTALLVTAIRLGLTLCSYRTVRRWIPKLVAPAHEASLSDASTLALAGRFASAVQLVSGCIPAASCLTQAIAVQTLMARAGQPSSLHIGVSKSEAGKFEAHAWVECAGQIIVGGVESNKRYTPIAAFDRL